MYSDDINDLRFNEEITPIKIIQNIELFIDHRGYFPISGISMKKSKAQSASVLNFLNDIYQWFSLPTMLGYNYIADQFESEHDFMSKHGQHALVTEKEIFDATNTESEDLANLKHWILFCHQICTDHGESLFSSSGGWIGFHSAEPIMSIMFSNRIMLIVSMRYYSIDRKGTGQIITGYEFLDSDAQLTNIYQIYSTGPRIGNILKSVSSVAELVGSIYRAIN